MKNNLRILLIALILVTLLMTSPGCRVGKGAVNQYHTLITYYQAGQKAAATGNSCLVLVYNQLNVQATLVNNYLVADIEKTRVYREALADYGTKFAEQSKAYLDQSGQPLQPNQLDLAELVKNGATPADMALTVQVYATTFNEAPLAAIDSAPVLNAQRIFSEQYNLAFACITDWNDAVEKYNVERNKIPGDVVGTIANELGVKELPASLPYFVMQAPAQPPTIPTISIGE